MDIRVSGHQVETGDALRQHVEERMGAIAEKYFSRAISAQVTFGKGPHDHGFRCTIVAHVMQGVILGYTVFGGGDEEGQPEDNPPIVAENRVDIPETSVSSAVHMLDLRNTNALLFKNTMTGVYNMVYRRRDGTIGWVEPDRSA
ncbi:MAG: HPF/RaiA family ribosome-associated protein [Sphingomonadales bacterium]|nr:HPF/RaiA family ribosome-associated protein [Sphingomonadales bacterium]